VQEVYNAIVGLWLREANQQLSLLTVFLLSTCTKDFFCENRNRNALIADCIWLIIFPGTSSDNFLMSSSD